MAILTNPYSFGAAAPPASSAFTFGIVATGSSFTLPLINDGVIDMDVDWGDSTTSTITTWNVGVTHAYAGSGTYTIEITGTIRGWRFWWGGSCAQMRDISNWGDFDFTTYGAFAGCSGLTCSATDAPNISGSSLGYSFYSCSVFNGDVTGWDTASITDMNGMFTLCNAFTGVGISGWDVSNSTGFNAMFVNVALFNQDISGWDTSSCQNLGQMFSGCTIFNQDLSGWDVSNVSNMGSVFQQCTAFDQDLSSWETGNATSMNDMFYNCDAFNADISGWDVSKVTNFQNTFNNCAIFNADLSSWDLGLCTRTIGMFQYATAFTGVGIGGWDVSNVEYFGSMFRGAIVNQDIGGWDTSTATNMFYMFRDNTAFDQDISSWDISGVTNFASFMQGATLSTVNYDALLIGWEAQSVVSGITINFGSSKYTGGGAAATARAALIAAPNSWTITDGGIA